MHVHEGIAEMWPHPEHMQPFIRLLSAEHVTLQPQC
jgi:hypothetical protein